MVLESIIITIVTAIMAIGISQYKILGVFSLKIAGIVNIIVITPIPDPITYPNFFSLYFALSSLLAVL
ncbi:hypothetical protein D3C81_1049010 [compost metagenome]